MIFESDALHCESTRDISGVRRGRALLIALAAAGTCLGSAAGAQAVPKIVGACSGVSLPRSVVTGILAPVVGGIVAPTERSVNGLLGVLGSPPLVPALAIDTTGLLAGAAAGQPITLQAIAADGTPVGPGDRCDLRSSSLGLDTQGGIAIGGDQITGLGTTGLDASAGANDAIAFGNGARTAAGAGGAIALGTGAQALTADSIALGAGSTAARGALAGYAALGLAVPQTSTGELSVGAPGAERQITNVAAGSTPSDAANVGQLAGVDARVTALGYDLDTLTGLAVRYDDATHARVTLGGAGAAPVRLGNIAAGTLAAGSTDAVDGGQLVQLGDQTAVAFGGGSYFDPATASLATELTFQGHAYASVQAALDAVGGVVGAGVGAGVGVGVGVGVPVGQGGAGGATVTLAGGTGTTTTNTASGTVSAGSTGAADGSPLYATSQAVTAAQATADTALTLGRNSVQYDGADRGTVTLAGANGTTVTNVAAGTVSASSTDAVNGSQLYATGQAVTAAQTTADTALVLGRNSVQYDGADRTQVSFGGGGAGPVTLHDVAPGVAPTDAVDVAQLGAGIDGAVARSNAYTDSKIAAIGYDLRQVRRDSDAGTAGALAAAGLPQAYAAGKGMIAMAVGTHGDQTAFAVGMSKAMMDGHTVVKLGGTYDSRSRAGASAGVGYQF